MLLNNVIILELAPFIICRPSITLGKYNFTHCDILNSLVAKLLHICTEHHGNDLDTVFFVAFLSDGIRYEWSIYKFIFTV